ncbi:unnamed protein product [Protopolystoma xenopodis]|uniref:Uncharacterized protein n=1 Tax=Protopolystoma xenopodis TaxID=117903 RepID=A0A3S5A6C6_9PLAT|nr:unnamed protein product [Protopolystoma xenopodis]
MQLALSTLHLLAIGNRRPNNSDSSYELSSLPDMPYYLAGLVSSVSNATNQQAGLVRRAVRDSLFQLQICSGLAGFGSGLAFTGSNSPSLSGSVSNAGTNLAGIGGLTTSATSVLAGANSSSSALSAVGGTGGVGVSSSSSSGRISASTVVGASGTPGMQGTRRAPVSGTGVVGTTAAMLSHTRLMPNPVSTANTISGGPSSGAAGGPVSSLTPSGCLSNGGSSVAVSAVGSDLCGGNNSNFVCTSATGLTPTTPAGATANLASSGAIGNSVVVIPPSCSGPVIGGVTAAGPMIQKNPMHIAALQEHNINPDTLVTPAIVIKNKEEREARQRAEAICAAQAAAAAMASAAAAAVAASNTTFVGQTAFCQSTIRRQQQAQQNQSSIETGHSGLSGRLPVSIAPVMPNGLIGVSGSTAPIVASNLSSSSISAASPLARSTGLLPSQTDLRTIGPGAGLHLTSVGVPGGVSTANSGPGLRSTTGLHSHTQAHTQLHTAQQQQHMQMHTQAQLSHLGFSPAHSTRPLHAAQSSGHHMHHPHQHQIQQQHQQQLLHQSHTTHQLHSQQQHQQHLHHQQIQAISESGVIATASSGLLNIAPCVTSSLSRHSSGSNVAGVLFLGILSWDPSLLWQQH